MNEFKLALRRYADFSGRSTRREYWMYVLFFILIDVALSLVDRMLGLYASGGYGLLSGLFAVALLIPSLAVGARRLHDTGRTGWWLLIGFIPLIGAIVLIVFFVQDSQPGANAHGPNPKGDAAAA
jgi:uncharacterized membrane protein YhaH (DUF805 family)